LSQNKEQNMITFPNAKINLGLNILEKRSDGYHNLETIFYPIQLHDALEITISQKNMGNYILNFYGKHINEDTDNNLVIKAYKIIKALHPTLPSIEIGLLKKIPMGAGLGGGSSDASHMIRLLNDYFHLDMSIKEMEQYAANLGADCTFFIQNKPAYATGIGNILCPIQLSLEGYYLIVIKPEIFVSTAKAYSMIKPRRPIRHLTDIIKTPIEVWKDFMINDFEESVFNQFPEIGVIKESLYQRGALYASMSGSGASVYGIFSKDSSIENLLALNIYYKKCFFCVSILK